MKCKFKSWELQSFLPNPCRANEIKIGEHCKILQYNKFDMLELKTKIIMFKTSSVVGVKSIKTFIELQIYNK
jgi:hypothetical protein